MNGPEHQTDGQIGQRSSITGARNTDLQGAGYVPEQVATESTLGAEDKPLRVSRWRTNRGRLNSSGILWIIGGTLLAAASAFLSSILTARGLPVEERGRYVQIIAASQLCGLVSSLGLTYPILSLSKGSSALAIKYLRQQMSPLLLASALGGTASFAWGYFLAGGLPEADRALLGLFASLLALLNVTLVSLQIPGKAHQDFRMIGTSTAITGVVALLGIAVLSIYTMLDQFTALAALATASSLAVGYVAFRSVKLPREAEPKDVANTVPKRKLVGLGARSLVVVAPSVLLVTADVLIVGWTVGLAGASIWAVAKTIATPVALVDGVAQNYAPSRLAAVRDRQASSRVVLLGSRATGLAGLFVGMVCVLLAHLFLVPVFGEEYSEAMLPAVLLTMTAVCTGVRSIPAMELNLRFDYRFLYAVNYGGGVLSLAAGVAAAAYFGLIGLAIALLITRAGEATVLALRVSRTDGRQRGYVRK